MNIYDRSIEISTEISIKLRGHDFRPSLEISNKTSIETELSKVIVNKEDMLKWSDRLREYFSTEEDRSGVNSSLEISDFSQIVVFAESADGMPFCLDYRNNKNKPSIIWWDDDHWIRICSDQDEFVKIFEPE